MRLAGEVHTGWIIEKRGSGWPRDGGGWGRECMLQKCRVLGYTGDELP